MCSTTSATTLAPVTVGEPTETLPSLLTSRTRSKVNGFARFNFQTFDFELVARGDTILFAAGF